MGLNSNVIYLVVGALVVGLAVERLTGLATERLLGRPSCRCCSA